MAVPSVALLEKLALARAIPFRSDRLSRSGWLRASDGVRLHYLDWSGGPDTLVLLHGGALSAHTFDLLALALGEAVRCVALDLRGHGESGWADDYSVERSAADVLQLFDHLELTVVHLAGMSLGGCVAGHAAVALGSRLASLSFIDVASAVNFEASARMRAFIEAARPVARVEDLVSQALAVSPATDPDLMLYRYQSLLKPGAEGFGWKADRRSPVDFPHILARLAQLSDLAPLVDCPVLVVKGGRSRVLTQAGLEAFAAGFPAGRWIVIPGAGHNVQEDQPAALALALHDVLAGRPTNKIFTQTRRDSE